MVAQDSGLIDAVKLLESDDEGSDEDEGEG
jgi:hypothetical protein